MTAYYAEIHVTFDQPITEPLITRSEGHEFKNKARWSMQYFYSNF